MRIVSLLPSATEMICAVGLEDQLVGVTHECDYPTFVQELPKVTHTLIPDDAPSGQIDQLVRERLQSDQALYRLNLPILESLKPDLIVTQALCGVCAVAENEVRAAACSLPGNPRIINLEPQTLSEVFDAMRQVGSAAGVMGKTEEVITKLISRVEMITNRTAGIQDRPRVALLEWLDPPFSCGHWNPELVRLAGGVEGLGRENHPSRTLTWKEVISWQANVVFIACCGFSVERTMKDVTSLWSVPGWEDLSAVQSGRVYVTDGSHYFSRPGPRLVDSLEIMAHTLHSKVHPLPEGLPRPIQITGLEEADRVLKIER